MQQAAARNLRPFKAKCLDVNFDLDNSEYRAVQNIGTGAYGVVCSAVHKKTSEKVAIKKIPNAFEELTTAKRTYRELKIMRHFRHENVIGIREILMPRESLNDFRDVYVVLDLMESDLHHIIHSQQSVSMEHIRYFLYQILRGLKYIHSANVVHRDLKPSNLLVNENCELKIGDFGMARGLSGNVDCKRKMFMTVYVATRWYRAPELLFSNEDYSYAVDMWSVGCIFAEMLGRKQIFPGRNPMHQLTLIIEVLGMPPDSLLRSTNSDQVYNFFHRNFDGKPRVNLQEKYPNLDEEGMDLLSKMLVFNPEERISVKDALAHPFLTKYHDPDDEPDCFPAFDFSFEQEDLSKQQIRQNVGKMILKYQRTKLFAGKKFPGSFSIAKPSSASTPSAAATQPTKSAILQPASTSVFPPKVLPTTNLPNNSQNSDKKNPPQDGVFKVPSIPVDEKKAAVSEPKPGKTFVPEIESLSVLPTLSVPNDVDMKSATKSTQNSAIGNTGGDSNASALHYLTASSGNTNLGDVEMKSAHGEQKQPLSQSSMGPSDTSASGPQDVDMKSARPQEGTGTAGDGTTQIAAQVEETLTESTKQSSVSSESTGQKTISDDTKKLIKAALLQSALKNKMRKDSEAERGGGKMPITALARQREREQKRRQKLRRSLERQKKSKGKSKKGASDKEADQHQLLTDEDRSMLERWNKMQSKAKEPESNGHVETAQANKNSSPPGAEPGTGSQKVAEPPPTHKGAAPVVAVSGVGSLGNSQPSSTNSSMPTHGDPLSSITNVISNVPISNVPQKQEIAPSATVPSGKIPALEPTSSVPQQQTADTVSSLANAGPSALFSFAALSPDQHNSYGVTDNMPSVVGSSSENFGMSNSLLFCTQLPNQSFTTNSNQAFYSSDKNPRAATKNPGDQHQENVVKISMGKATVPISETPTGQCPPTGVSSVTAQATSKVDSSAEFQQYRSRHYSDRETPSPPHIIQQSPPAYEDAMKTKYTTSYASPTGSHQSYPYKHNTQYPNIKKPSPVFLGASAVLPHPRAAPSPPELAQVIRQLSKSAMEDSLPPVLQVTPKGDGTGYGLSLDWEDWLQNSLGSPPTGASKLDSGPLSASLLSDWLEVRDMNVDDMIAVQQELGLTSPFNLSDIPGLVESPKNKDRV